MAGGTVSFGRALWVGLLITFVASTCYVVTWEVIYHRYAPDFTRKYAAHHLAKAKEAGATDAEIAAETDRLAKQAVMYDNPLFNVAVTFLEPLPVGLVVTLVTAGVLGRRRPDSRLAKA